MPTSVIVAAIVGFVLGAITNFTVGLICGAMFGLVAWSLTGFRIGNAAPTAHANPQTTVGSPEMAQARGLKAPNLSSLSPQDVGRGLAISLDTSCKPEDISAKERELLRDANVPIERYHQELLLLAGFAQDYAIFTLLGHSEVGKQVLAGYREAWQNVAKASPAGAALFQLFAKRCPEYAKAAREDEETAKLGATAFISRIALIFGGHIRPEA